MADPVPLITIGGFLGAGKTTLVNHVLSQTQGQRIVVFVNDFGAINIDHDLIETADANRVSLKNGCVCCSLNDDLIASIVEFCQAAPPDAFVIEASGVADPRALDASIFSLQQAGHVLLDTRAYLVDAENFGAQDYADTETIIDHAAASDLLVINKHDLVSPDVFENLCDLFKRSAPNTDRIKASFARVPLSVLLGVHPDRTAPQVPVTLPDMRHSDQYHSWSRTGFDPLDRDRLDDLITQLKISAFRAKGVLFLLDAPDRAVQFDLVGKRVTFRPHASRATSETARIVAIGRVHRLDAERLDECLDLGVTTV